MLYEADHPAGPRHYSIVAGGSHLDMIAYELDGRYRLRLFGPNGFYRQFDGRRPTTAFEALQLGAGYAPKTGELVLTLVNRGMTSLVVHVVDELYGAAARQHTLAPGGHLQDRWSIAHSDHWYDLLVRLGDGK